MNKFLSHQKMEIFNTKFKWVIFLGLLLLLMPGFSQGQTDTLPTPSDSIMITIMMKHHQDKNIEELREIRNKNGFLEKFPPASARVINWYVMMGIGQVVTLKIPASELRNLNIAVEQSVWGAFSTEFYPTYDLYPVIKEAKENLNKGQ
ncbi:hypothetical protein [Cyclobacterium marinum]|mgnify:FL=1|uniref:hypothetical protein n=1 Tax=Cyclobacterium marinum TaxID=104 RepID=UPI0030DB399C